MKRLSEASVAVATLAALILLAACAHSESDPASVPPISQIPESRELLPKDPLAAEMQHVDPGIDGWDTEAFNEAASARLNDLAHLLADPAGLDPASLEPFLVDGFTSHLLRPPAQREILSREEIAVSRGRPEGTVLSGPPGLADALRSIAKPYDEGTEIHAGIKIVSVVPDGEGRFDTDVLVQFWGSGEAGVLQQNGTWEVSWVWPDPDEPPGLAAIRLVKHEENRVAKPLFADCTEAVIGHERAYREQFLRGTDDWCARIDYSARMNQFGHNGLAVGDVDNDGLDDIYICQTGGLPNRLFRQNPDGTATEIGDEAGVNWLNESRSALFVDLDNNGSQDLLIATMRGLLVMRGDGAGHFELAGELPTTSGYTLAAADYDEDGLLDVYVSNYSETTGTGGGPTPYYDANNGPPNALYRNLGDFRFEDVTVEVGLDENNRRFSFAAAWADYDEDGDLDVYVANDFGRNNLYRNDGGRFRDVAAAVGVEDQAAGMGVTWADYNHDGHLDLYVSNMFSSAGQRITYQRRFVEGTSAEALGALRRHARGNSLFENQGDGTFRDVTLTAEAWMGRWTWGARFLDMNNDGHDDIYVPNGFFTNENTKDL